jgi:5-aminolevulinate synthase
VIRSYAPGFIFHLAVAGAGRGRAGERPPPQASAVEREGQQAAAARLKAMMRDAGLPGDAGRDAYRAGDGRRSGEAKKKISDILLAEYGVYVQPINYPTARAAPNACASRRARRMTRR